MFEAVFPYLLYISFSIKAVGYFVRDELKLRSLVSIGMVVDILFYALREEPVVQSVIVNSALITINMLLISVILLDRTTWFMSAREKDLFTHFPTFRPGQFRKVMKLASWTTVARETRLFNQGDSIHTLYYVRAPHFCVIKHGERTSAPGPALIGELVFLHGGHTSATVLVPSGAEVISFDSARLRSLMSRSLSFNNAVMALLGNDMAHKVRNSIPISKSET